MKAIIEPVDKINCGGHISTVSCGKLCGQLTIKHTKRLNLLDFERSAHTSGSAAKLLRPSTCIGETRSPTSNTRPLIAFLLSTFILCASACATLPKRASADAHLDLNNSTVKSVVPLNINLASVSELEKLPGVGKAIAERIVAYRLANGPFRRAEHLMMVRGISDTKFRAMRSLIVVD